MDAFKYLNDCMPVPVGWPPEFGLNATKKIDKSPFRAKTVAKRDLDYNNSLRFPIDSGAIW